MRKTRIAPIDLASILIVLAACAFVVRALLSSAAAPDRTLPEIGIPAEVLAASSTGLRLGPKHAPVTLVVWFDYECSYCRTFNAVLDTIRERYPEHVAVVFKHFIPLTNSPAVDIAMAAVCAADINEGEAFHSLAVRYPRTHRLTGGWRILADSLAISDRAAFDICVESARPAPAIAEDYAQGRALGVAYTPTTFVNQTRVEGAVDFNALDSLVVAHLRRSIQMSVR